MVFTTLKFMVFMSAVFVLYYTVFRKHQWKFLLAASYVFYAFAFPPYILFLLGVTAVTYGAAYKISSIQAETDRYISDNSDIIDKNKKKNIKAKSEKSQKKWVIAVIIILLALLVVTKYAVFLLKNVKNLLGIFNVSYDFPAFSIIFPIGLSFYLFQSLGYVIDVYRKTTCAETDFFRHALFVSYFPQLLQGPIGEKNLLAPQLFSDHAFDYKNCVFGLQRAAWGFFKKLVIANSLATVFNSVWTNYENNYGMIWILAVIAYAFELYADFSGYMDIALGCSQMLGISLEENFQEPYFSKDIAEYWRRWHITLGKWFRNYVFYSLLRSKKIDGLRKKYKKSSPYLSTALPTVISLVIVWLMIGLWHGSDWSYVAYGMYHGFFVIMANVFAPFYSKFHKKHTKLCSSKWYKCFQIARTFIIVEFGYYIFVPADLSATKTIIRNIFASPNIRECLVFGYNNLTALISAAMGVVVLFFVDKYHLCNQYGTLRERISSLSAFKRYAIYTLFLLSIVFLGIYGIDSLNQFAYFAF